MERVVQSVFPLKLGKRGKYRVFVREYLTKFSELCIKDYAKTSPKTMDVDTIYNTYLMKFSAGNTEYNVIISILEVYCQKFY